MCPPVMGDAEEQAELLLKAKTNLQHQFRPPLVIQAQVLASYMDTQIGATLSSLPCS